MDADTQIGGPADRFPETRWSAIVAAGSPDAVERTRARERIVAAYWKPVYKYIRIQWRQSNEDAKDLTQGFFTRALEKDFFQQFDPEKASFRTYLRVCLDGFVSNENKSAQRIKRAPETPLLSLDFASAEEELRRHPFSLGEPIEDYFHREWVRGVLGLAVEALRRDCESRGKQIHFRLFEQYDLNADDARPTYNVLASEFGIAVTDVTNHLAFARREFRRIVLDTLRQITANEREFRAEVRSLLGIEV